MARFICRNNRSFFHKAKSPFRQFERIPNLFGYHIHRFVSYMDDNRIASYYKGCEYRREEDIRFYDMPIIRGWTGANDSYRPLASICLALTDYCAFYCHNYLPPWGLLSLMGNSYLGAILFSQSSHSIPTSDCGFRSVQRYKASCLCRNAHRKCLNILI